MSRLEPYIYTPLPPGHIRLLHVPPQFSPTGTLSCNLKIFSLHERPQYEALSYAWGTEQAFEHIVCNGAKLPVTPHLLEGLRSISKALFVQWLWIDAICINQSDDVEKANQVMQMWQIYSAASRVVVWMGPSNITANLISAIRAVSSDITANLISTIRVVSEDPDNLRFVRENKSHAEIKRILSPVALRNDIVKLFTPSWFERLWVIQEIVLAHAAIALYGTQVIDLWSVLELGRWIDVAGINVQNLPSRLPLEACSSFSGCKHFAKHELKGEGVIRLLSAVRNKQTSERLDRVYAILGLLDEHIRDQVIIDYSQASKEEYWNAYVCLCRLILQEYGESYLPYLSITDRSTVMPSWCLNLGVEEGSGRLYNPQYRVSIDASNTACGGLVFSGSGLVICLVAFQVDVIENMALSGPVGTSTAVIDDLWLEEGLLFLSSCNDLLVEMASCEETTTLKSLATVLVGGIHAEESFARQYTALEAEEDLHTCLEICTNAQLNLAQKSDLLRHGRNLSYIISAKNACVGRNISLTMGGQFVLVPKDTQKGDIIVIIKGCQFPYVLRPVPGEDGQDSNTYNIIGGCYVDDIMDGEVLQTEAFKAAGWTDINII